ncbi:MAG TPA: tyrosine--tRNA ligase [bacterium]|nr:tyrosine--tRNA ligase [bacterium]
MGLQEQLRVLKRGAVEVIQETEFVEKLRSGRPLRIKAGFDPTAPDLHLGHTVLLQKLKQFQDLGHHVLFLIGDFTAMIGDPSGRSETRPPLSEEQVQRNVKTYQDQVFKILDPQKTEIAFNAQWLSKMNAKDMIRLASRHTVARMLERDDFEKRYRKGESIAIHEFLYPLLQGYDSVALKADVELGGTDQKFNLLVGRELQRQDGQAPQIVMTLPLLVGTDGVQKMSKSYGNFIGIQESPGQIFGKVMSISDELMWSYYELLSDLDIESLRSLRKDVASGREHPKEVKIRLARELVARFHGEAASQAAAAEFENIFKNKGLPDDIETIEVKSSEGRALVDILVRAKLAPSKSEVRRLIKQGGVTVDDKKINNIDYMVPSENHLIRVGKRKFLKIHII